MSVNKEKTEKILNRVRKLLAMSKDTSSPHEAAIAAKRARKLIDEYQIQEYELHAEKAFEFKASIYETFKKYNTDLGIMSVAIAKLNDCQARLVNTVKGSHYVFEGMLVDSVTCVEMMIYLRAELYMQSMDIKGKRNKNAYSKGFASGIADQVREILKERKAQTMQSTGQSLVVIKTELVEKHFGTVRYTRARHGYHNDSAYGAGYNSGKNANLSRQISDDFAAKIGN